MSDDRVEVIPPGEKPESTSLFKDKQIVRFLGAQFASSLGDWIGLVAILALSARLAAGTGLAIFGPGIVLITRTLPGFLFGQLAGPLVDRWDRRKVMVICDVIRGLLMATLPFVPNLGILVVNQLLFEIVTMLWQPAKEASVPDVAKSEEQISRINSIGQMAAYGTFPLGALAFAGLSQLAVALGEISFFKAFGLNQESLALFVDSATFFIAALLISGLNLPRREAPARKLDFTLAIREVREGYREINRNVTVRTVIFGMTTAVFGAGSVVSLGAIFVQNDLDGGPSGFGVMMTTLGTGAAVGVLLLETIGKKIRREALFSTAILMAGIFLFLSSLTGTLKVAALFVGLVGFFAAPAYISGLTVVHESADEEFRGRSFAALLSLTRLAIMMALAISPLVAGALSGLANLIAPTGSLDVFGFALKLSGTRMTFWLSGSIVMAVGVVTGLRFWSGIEHPRPAEEVSRARRKDMPASGGDPFRPTGSIELTVESFEAFPQVSPTDPDQTLADPVASSSTRDQRDPIRSRHEERRARRERWRRGDSGGE